MQILARRALSQFVVAHSEMSFDRGIFFFSLQFLNYTFIPMAHWTSVHLFINCSFINHRRLAAVCFFFLVSLSRNENNGSHISSAWYQPTHADQYRTTIILQFICCMLLVTTRASNCQLMCLVCFSRCKQFLIDCFERHKFMFCRTINFSHLNVDDWSLAPKCNINNHWIEA